MTRPRTPANLSIELDLSAAFDHQRGFGRADLLQFAPRLEEARQRLIDEAAAVDAHWLNWPRQLLEDHDAQRTRSLLGRWMAAAKHFRHTVDRAVILGSPQRIAVAGAIFAACCHPYHNELSRGQRGGRPRIYFVSTEADNDALQGLFDILPQGRVLRLEEERWGIVAIDDGRGGDLLTAIFKVFWDALLGTTEPGEEAERAIAIGAANCPLECTPHAPREECLRSVKSTLNSPHSSPLLAFAEQAGCARLPLADGELPTRNAIFHPGVLLAAAVMNVNIVHLLAGAVGMTDRFRAAPPGDNPPLDFAGYCHLLAERRGIGGRAIDCPTGLKPLAQSLGFQPLHSGRDNQLLIQWQPTNVRRDRLRVTMPAGEAPSGRKKTTDRHLPDVSAAAAEAIRDRRAADGLPTVVVRLPTVDESAVAQLLQMGMIVEAASRSLAAECTLHAPP